MSLNRSNMQMQTGYEENKISCLRLYVFVKCLFSQMALRFFNMMSDRPEEDVEPCRRIVGLFLLGGLVLCKEYLVK